MNSSALIPIVISYMSTHYTLVIVKMRSIYTGGYLNRSQFNLNECAELNVLYLLIICIFIMWNRNVRFK